MSVWNEVDIDKQLSISYRSAHALLAKRASSKFRNFVDRRHLNL